MTIHPTDFYIAHRLYTLNRNHVTVTKWGSFTDGPEDRQSVLYLIADALPEHGNGQPLSLDNLRVWHFQSDVPVRDVTEDMLADAAAQVEAVAA